MTAQSEPHDLNENHLRRLRTAMSIIDAAAAKVLGLLDEANSSPMNVVGNSVSSDERREVETLIQQLRPLTWEFAQKYGLEPHHKDVRRIVVAEISRLWTILEGLHANKLRGMGVIPQPIAEQLNADVDSMLKIVEQLKQIFFTGAAE